jgi:Rrf2 family protein
MFSKSCEYAIRAMLFVAQKSTPEIRIGAKEIAKGIDAPEHFIAKIMQDLGKKKLVHSVKGPNGGFYVDEHHLKASISDIVKAVDANGIYMDCVLGLKVCSEKTPCPVHFEYKIIQENMIQMIENQTISAFTEPLNIGNTYLK